MSDWPSRIVNVAVEKSYVPIGFDDNDRVQVTVTGVFPSTCYAKRIGERCDFEKSRFMKTVELDPSLAGTYLLHVRSMNGQAINKLVDANFIE